MRRKVIYKTATSEKHCYLIWLHDEKAYLEDPVTGELLVTSVANVTFYNWKRYN